ncbi:efflux RND transporter periplasmic adaptor subunit [Ferrovibrio sp.]|uniref:efflux RND transporter periplasmic adaptor subunit n=1 Tax=Ferrovibrio sp. TaxID=1917215 RepID=UPI000CBA3DB6|nr:efflux RND transporter periplasmic adaptor subunit [Ferrovibrio sp.]PJI39023.1 MAG: efflux transporter periplasmic adaptor subunit [Ferrovibrio sp.]
MKRAVKIGLSVAVLVVLAGGGLYVLKGRQPARAVATAETTKFSGLEFSPADLAQAKRADLRQVVRLNGTIQPFNQSLLRAEVAAVVNEISVRRGESVKKGQLLARLDTSDVGARMREKQSNLESARSALKLAEINREKAITLTQRGVKSQTALDEAENAWRNARANVAAMEQQLSVARKSVHDAAIYAPLDGLVAERFVNPGERVAIDAKLFSIADLDLMEVEALVPARDVPQLRAGQKVVLHVEGFGDRRFDAHIERINPTAQSGSRSIPVYVLLQNPEHVLRGGMFGAGEAVLVEAPGVIAIPGEALREENGTRVVYVLKDGKLERRAVKVALQGSADGRIGIAEGVAENETVVATPGLRLNDGLAARIAGR